MNRCLFSLLVLAVSSTVARAHFIWIVPDDKGATAQVIFSDSLQPDAPDLLAKIAKTEVFVRTAEAKTIPLKWTESKEQNSYIISVEGAGDRTLGGVCRYGVIQRGNSEPSFLLNYHAKAFLGWPLEAAAEGKVLQ